MDGKTLRPILGRRACVEIVDSHAQYKPDLESDCVYALETDLKLLSKQQILCRFPNVFSDGVMEMKYIEIVFVFMFCM